MKKVYSEPDILFESFALSTNIAAGCELQPTNNQERCGAQYSARYILFNKEVADNCNRSPGNTNSDYFDQFCYHVHASDLNVFFS